jgi:hypothetical protein
MTGTVYALRHKKTLKFIIGSTRDFETRKKQWRSKFHYKKLPREMQSVSQDFDEWEFIVLAEMPAETIVERKRLRFTETQAIVTAYVRHPEQSLNTSRFGFSPFDRLNSKVSRSTYYARLSAGMDKETAATLQRGQGHQRKTAIVDDDGKILNYTQAAERLGCQLNTLQKRLRVKRKKDPHLTSITLRQLLTTTKQWRYLSE